MSLTVSTAWPAPNLQAQTASAALAADIRAAIDTAGGAISFAQFMTLALYAPGRGYYQTQGTKFGAAGDFTTAPEVGSLFARCLARQCQQIFAHLGGGEILELGAGSGALALTLLRELEHLECLPERYLIHEISIELRQCQRALISSHAPHLLPRVIWLDDLQQLPFTGVILANEVLDALPVQCFRIGRDQLRERCVSWQDGRFVWCERAADASLSAAVAALQADLIMPLPRAYCSEINTGLPEWIAALGARLSRGVVLFFDYGYPRREYYLPERSSGTLLCHYRHQVHADPLILPGLQDITAHVDFTTVVRAATTAGLTVAGYTPQTYFLFGNGLLELAQASDPQDVRSHRDMTDQVKILSLPGAMGERFKVLALSRDYHAPLNGFALRDLRDRL